MQLKKNADFLKRIRMPNAVLVVFSLSFLYFLYIVVGTVAAFHRGHPDQKMIVIAAYGTPVSLFSIGPILAWHLRWKSLNKTYRRVAIFFFIVFAILFVIYIRILLIAFISSKVWR